MPNTTIAAIRLALRNTIEGTTPLTTVDPMGAARYVFNTGNLDGDASSDMDREFCFDQFGPGVQTMFGTDTESDYQGTLKMRIAHVVVDGDVEASRVRADSDVGHLRRVLEKVTNYPAAVSRIQLQDVSQRTVTVADAEFIESTLTFQISYTLAAV
jgi:hypothetical protein